MPGGSALAFAQALALALVLALAPQGAEAFVPRAERALAAVAQANATSGRTEAIQLELVMRVGDRDAIATGELVSHPSGLARLELRGSGGRVDRYLLSGSELLAATDGEPLANPQPMLQPVFLLQPSTQETLRAALESFGIDSRAIALAPCGELDCYVFGDPALAAPRVFRLPDGDSEGGGGEVDSGAPGGGILEIEPAKDPRAGETSQGRVDPRGSVARLWADTQTLQIQRIDRESGESMQLGPLTRFERLMVPAWIEIHAPGQPVIRFDVKRAARVNANPQAFNPSWLYSPIDRSSPEGDPARSGSAVPAPASPSRP